MYTALFKVLTTALAPEVYSLLAAQLQAGSPLDVAVRNVLAQLEAEIPNPVFRAAATEVLNSLVTIVEHFGAAAVGASSPQPAA